MDPDSGFISQLPDENTHTHSFNNSFSDEDVNEEENQKCLSHLVPYTYSSDIEEADSERFRSVGKTNLYRVSFPAYKSMFTQSCQSTGRESILSLVKKIFQKPGNRKRKPQFENIVFLNANNECLNVGLPVGVLSTEETYKCYFKRNLVFRPSDLSRQYDAEEYNSDWNLGSFFVSFSDSEIAPGVSHFSKIVSTKLRVDFFNDETIFEALVRDSRFKEKKLRCCKATYDDQVQISLSSESSHIQGKCIQISCISEKDTELPECIQPRLLPDPSVTTACMKPSHIKQESATSATCTPGSSSLTPVDSSTPSTARTSRKTEKSVIKITFDVNKKELNVNNVKKLEQFALAQGSRSYMCDLEDLTEIGKSVGAIFELDSAKQPHQVGTCFRIGTEYIITNNHVVKNFPNVTQAEESIFVDFNFKRAGEPHSERRFIDKLMARSMELDYAILRMKEPREQLPPCIFSHGVSIMDPHKSDWSMLHGNPLRLIGHPQEEPKQVDLGCTVDALPQDGLKFYVYMIRRGEKFEGEAKEECLKLKDKRRGRYQTSGFFNGSSGSPGIIFLPSRKWLVFLHTCGFRNERNQFFIEQGVLLSEIVKDVERQIRQAHQDDPLKDLNIEDIFPKVDGRVEPMDIGE